jgi:hypothetical protein
LHFPCGASVFLFSSNKTKKGEIKMPDLGFIGLGEQLVEIRKQITRIFLDHVLQMMDRGVAAENKGDAAIFFSRNTPKDVVREILCDSCFRTLDVSTSVEKHVVNHILDDVFAKLASVRVAWDIYTAYPHTTGDNDSQLCVVVFSRKIVWERVIKLQEELLGILLEN